MIHSDHKLLNGLYQPDHESKVNAEGSILRGNWKATTQAYGKWNLTKIE